MNTSLIRVTAQCVITDREDNIRQKLGPPIYLALPAYMLGYKPGYGRYTSNASYCLSGLCLESRVECKYQRQEIQHLSEMFPQFRGTLEVQAMIGLLHTTYDSLEYALCWQRALRSLGLQMAKGAKFEDYDEQCWWGREDNQGGEQIFDVRLDELQFAYSGKDFRSIVVS